MWRQRAVIASSGVLVTVLAGAGVAAVTAVSHVRDGFQQVETARTAVLRFDDVRSAISREAFAEASYRRSPSDATRRALERALADVPATLVPLTLKGDASDRAVARQLEVLNRRYASEVSSDLRTGTAAPGIAPDDRVAGPALDAMKQLVDSAVVGHRATAAAARQRQKDTVDRLSIIGPIALISALGAVLVCWLTILRQHKRLLARAARSEFASLHDPLTGLANRTLMWRELDAALAQQPPDCALLLVDLDRFKAVNDTLGHAAGDQVLAMTAARLTEYANSTSLVARLGGDEFAVLVRPAADAERLAAALAGATRRPYDVPLTGPVTCTATVGVAVAQPGQDRVELLRAADEAMYDGKPRRVRLPEQRASDATLTMGRA